VNVGVRVEVSVIDAWSDAAGLVIVAVSVRRSG
jgi:hypothetical protein